MDPNLFKPDYSRLNEAMLQLKVAEAEKNAFNRGFAHVLYDRLMHQIAEFEKGLKPNEEIGAYLASFGTQVIVQIEHVGYHNPYFIIFEGFSTSDGQKVKLVQHVSQLNVLFVAINLKDTSRPPRRIGFEIKKEETGTEENE
ncbi:MAG: DUF6173 family protein [Bacteroidota bacterium]|jgi:hypothetical protein